MVDDWSIPNAIEKLRKTIESRPSGAFPRNAEIALMIQAGMVDLTEILRCPVCEIYYLPGYAMTIFDESGKEKGPGCSNCLGLVEPLKEGWYLSRASLFLNMPYMEFDRWDLVGHFDSDLDGELISPVQGIFKHIDVLEADREHHDYLRIIVLARKR